VTVAQAAANLVLSDSILTFASLSSTTQLTATVTDASGETMSGATVTWATSDAAVATVSSTGLVTSVANGTATITATSGSTSAAASVTVATATVWASISAGHGHTVGLTPSGVAYAWGYNDRGQLGDGTTTIQRSTPTLVSGGHTWASISAGGFRTVGITTSGEAYAWGGNSHGQLGDGTMTDRTTPTLVSGGHTWTSISTETFSTVGLTPSGVAYAWGYNGYGQVGDGTTTDRTTPTLVSGGYTWASISAGTGQHTVGITTTGEAYAWGFNGYGQLGDGTTTLVVMTPRLVSGDHTWASIAAGNAHTVGLTTSGVAYAWGRNFYGELGDGTTIQRTTPVLQSGGHTWASISAGGYHQVGITTSGEAYAWGWNRDGQLGDGTMTDRTTPTLVSGGHTWASISAGHYDHTVGLTPSGVAYAWGHNLHGQLGTRLPPKSTTPLLVGPRS